MIENNLINIYIYYIYKHICGSTLFPSQHSHFFYICIASPSTFPSLNNGQYFALHCCQVMKAWLSCRKLRFRLRCLKLSFVMFSMWHFAWWKEQPRTLAVQVVLVISNTPGILEPISNIPGCSFEIYMFLLEVMQDMTPRSFTAVCRTYFWWKEARNRRQLYLVIHGPYKKSVSHEHNELLYMWFQFILCNRILIHPDLFFFEITEQWLHVYIVCLDRRQYYISGIGRGLASEVISGTPMTIVVGKGQSLFVGFNPPKQRTNKFHIFVYIYIYLYMYIYIYKCIFCTINAFR